jgi:hypothetical protein
MTLDQRGQRAADDLLRYADDRAAGFEFDALRRRDRHARVLSAAVALMAVVAVVIATAWLAYRGDAPVATSASTTLATASPTSPAPTPSVVVPEPAPTIGDPTTLPVAPVPDLGTGWEIVVSSRPGDAPLLAIETVVPTPAGYYVSFFEDDATDWYLVPRDGRDQTLIDVDVPASGFVVGGPGVIAWATVGPETRTEAQLWASRDGVTFERAAQDVLVGCTETPGCRGTEIYAAAASPTGRVVALAFDPLVWDPECECFDLNPVALVSDDGFEWTRRPLDLTVVLPEEWQGAADIRKPLVHVGGRWLTYAAHYRNDCMCTDTAFFASSDGIDWHAVDTGDLFTGISLSGMVASDRGVVATTMQDAFWSPDGTTWTHRTVTDREYLDGGLAAYAGGYVASSIPGLDGDFLSAIWYSPDGTTWSRAPLTLGEPAIWNTIVGDGPDLVALGGTQSNLYALWRWTG